MALSASSVFEVRFPGSDTNGGGFVTGAAGTDYSQQDNKNTAGADISTADGVANGTTTFTSATANFGTTIVGNIVYFQGGTGAIAATWRQVTARASTTSITIDASIAASTGMTMNIGGALASPGQAAAIATVATQTIYVKYNVSPYLITSASTNVAAGCVSFANSKVLVGYDTTRTLINTDTNRPTLKASGISTAIIVTGANNNTTVFRNLIVDGQALTSIRAFSLANLVSPQSCKAMACTNGGFVGSGGVCFNCEATTCSTVAGFSLVSAIGCVAQANTFTGFSLGSSGLSCIRCLSYNNTGASSLGFDNNSAFQTYMVDCTAYGNGSHGFGNTSGGGRGYVTGCIAEANTGLGFSATSLTVKSCATYNNTGGSITAGNADNENNVVNSTGTFFVNAGSGNFALNNTANTGAAARAAATNLNSIPLGLTVGYADIGAAQHQDTPSTSSIFPIFD